MKKVGVVSCYFQENYGSMLQAYATQRILDELGYENETIRIDGFNDEIKSAKMKYFIKAALTSDILLYKTGKAINNIRIKLSGKEINSNYKIRHKSFGVFKDKWFRLSERYNSKAELSKKCKENYHTVLVGSDQLWLPANIAADYYTLNFVPEGVNTIAYATSFGQSTLPKDVSVIASNFLKKLKYVSVREVTGQELVKNLANRDVPVVCDPTLLFNSEQWMEIQDQEPLEKGNYIFCYFLGNNPEQRDFAKKLKERTGYKIIALTHLPEYKTCDEGYADETPYDIDPAEFVNLIRNAQYVCTDSFHCTVFSILYKRKFFTFRRFTKNTKVSTNSRLDTLFDLTGIENHILTGYEDIEKCLKLKINYDEVNAKLENIRKQSMDYLKNALQNNN